MVKLRNSPMKILESKPRLSLADYKGLTDKRGSYNLTNLEPKTSKNISPINTLLTSVTSPNSPIHSPKEKFGKLKVSVNSSPRDINSIDQERF